MAYPEKKVGGICPDCGGKYVQNPRTSKLFCENKCWLNKQQGVPADTRGEEIKKMHEEKKENIRWQGAKNKSVDIALAKMAEIQGDEALQAEIKKWANFLYKLEPDDIPF